MARFEAALAALTARERKLRLEAPFRRDKLRRPLLGDHPDLVEIAHGVTPVLMLWVGGRKGCGLLVLILAASTMRLSAFAFLRCCMSRTMLSAFSG